MKSKYGIKINKKQIMSTEELLKQRRKVIAPYPNSPYKIGEILTEFFFDNGNSYFSVNSESGFHDKIVSGETIKECPNIFSTMNWWEERELNDMPEYVRFKSNGEILRIAKRAKGTPSDVYCQGVCKGGFTHYYQWLSLYDMMPSTKEEYEQYLKTKQQ